MSESTVPEVPPQAHADAAAETNSGAPTTEYDPSQSMDGGEYDPSQPAEYDPSQPAEHEAPQQEQHHDPAQEQQEVPQPEHSVTEQPEGGKGEAAAEQGQQEYDPSQQQEYDPSVPTGEYDPSHAMDDYDPSRPTGDYDPSQPTGDYDPSQPTGDYDPSQPQDYDPSQPTGAEDDQMHSEVPSEGGPMAAPVPEPEPGVVPGLPQVNTETSIAPAPAAAPLSAAPRSAAPDNDDGYEEEVFKADLPEGLTPDSPSVIGNPEVVLQYRREPSEASNVLTLFNWSIQRSEIADARVWYNVLAVENPTASQPLLALINLELALNNFEQVEALFGRALRSSFTLMAAADVNIWKAYLHYIRRQNPNDGPDPAATRTTVIQAYEYALKECGVDRESGEIWQEYISYLLDFKSKNPWEQQQNQDNVRKLYQRAVVVPLNNVEALWKAYDAFESGQNKMAAKKFLADRSPAYMTARTALREMRNLTDFLPQPVIPPQPEFTDEDRRVVTGWRNYLKWEEGNPLGADDATVTIRLAYAFRKCMAQMRHFPELWHFAAQHYLSQGKEAEGKAFLQAGVAACPKSFLLSFALAELEEDARNFAECHTIFTNLIDRLNVEIDELKLAVEKEVEAARGPEVPPAAHELNNEESDYARLVRERDERGRLVQERRGKDIDDAKAALGIVWVMYMRFARRAEGLKAARLVFGKARKSPHVTWHSFEASALMEYHSNKDSAVAVRIFELGLKQFDEDVPYVTKYLEFLHAINDDTNARALFERSALKIPADRARSLWDTWARYENMYGDLTAVRKLEQRWSEAFPADSALKRFAQRFTFDGIDEIALRDLGFGRNSRAPAPPVAQAPPHALPPAGVGMLQQQAAGFAPRSPQKRPLSPAPIASPGRGDKRQRPASPVPPARGMQRFGSADNRPPMPPMPPRNVPPRAAPTPPGHVSGLPNQLVWFIGQLPPTRSFDGPVFRPDDIIGLFSNIAANGTGNRAVVPPRGPPAGYGGRRY